MARIRTKGGVIPDEGTPAYEQVLTQLEREERTDAEYLRRKATQARAKRRLLARTDVNEFCAQVGRDGETNERIVQTELHEEFQMIADECPRCIVMAFPESGKALAVDTPIPTPQGLVNLLFLEAGDYVFDRRGDKCKVMFATPTMHGHDVYQLTFSDGGTIRADADHRWIARRIGEDDWQVVTTVDMVYNWRDGWQIPLSGAVSYSGSEWDGDDAFAYGVELAAAKPGPDAPTSISSAYMFANVYVRRDLYAGLFSKVPLMSHCSLTLCSEGLARDVLSIVRSLGIYAWVEGTKVLTNHTRFSRNIAHIGLVESVGVRCISVDSEDHSYLAGADYTVTHNTSQLSILRLLYMIGRNPNIHIALVSKTGSTSKKSATAIREYIERNEDLQEIFPELLPGNKWGDSAFTVKRSSYSKDPTVQSLGLGGTLIGSRVDVLVFDDILDDENTRSANERKKVYKRVKTFMDRLSASGVVIMLTNAWHPDDTAHQLERDGVPIFRFPVVDEDGKAAWPLKWTQDRLEQSKIDLGPLEFARAFLCKARGEGESPFDEAAVDNAFGRAREMRLVRSLHTSSLPPGAWVYTGVDLAVSKGSGAHHTAFVTILLWPESNGTLSRQVLWAVAGRWSSSEIRDQFLDHNRRYSPTFIVESNAAQRWILDIVENQSDLEVEERQSLELIPFTTGRNKAHALYGVEGLAVEIARGQWLFPVEGPVREHVEQLKAEMLYYTRGGHTGDLLMAMWFAREGARRGAGAGKVERDGDDGGEIAEIERHRQSMQSGDDGGEAGVMVID